MPEKPQDVCEGWINAILNGAESDIHASGSVAFARAELAALRSRPTWDEVIDGVREFCTERHVGEMTVRCDCMHMIAAVRKRKEANEDPDPRAP